MCLHVKYMYGHRGIAENNLCFQAIATRSLLLRMHSDGEEIKDTPVAEGHGLSVTSAACFLLYSRLPHFSIKRS